MNKLNMLKDSGATVVFTLRDIGLPLPVIASIAYVLSLLLGVWFGIRYDRTVPLLPLDEITYWLLGGYVGATVPAIIAHELDWKKKLFAWLAAIVAGAVAVLFANRDLLYLAIPGFALVLFYSYSLTDQVNADAPTEKELIERRVRAPALAPVAPQADSEESKILFPARPARYTLSDVDGMTTTVDELFAAVKAAAGGRNEKDPQGILLSGEPGTGKTFLSEAVAGEVELPFMLVDVSGINSHWVGETTGRLVKAFDDAIAQAPVVMLIDEVDAVIPDRSKVVSADSEVTKTVSAFLTQMTRIRGKQVVVIAATNFLDRLDAAAIREGRFDWKIRVPLPDLEARIGLLDRTIAGGDIDATDEVLRQVAIRWEGFSVARMKAIGREATKNIGPEGTMTAQVLMDAYLKVRGDPPWTIPESTPDLSGVYLDDDTAERLSGLASRMKNILAVEKQGGTIPSGVLFHGVPGTGKTLVARALAKESGWTFVATKGPDLLNSNEEIEQVIERASTYRPAIIFIDEAEDILMDRNYSAARHSTNKLLAELDGATSRLHDVIVVAATNHPEILDDAMMRGGRFGQKIEFRLPTHDIIVRFTVDWMRSHSMNAAEDLTPEAVADEMQGRSLADVNEVLQAAINVAIDRRQSANILLEDLQAAKAHMYT